MIIVAGRHGCSRRLSTHLLFSCAAVCLAFLLPGCESRGPVVHLVKGVVTLDGVALAGADVGFSPMVPGEGLSAVGGTQEDGSFTLNAVGASPGRGTATGDYVVTVRKFESEPTEPFISYEERGRDTPPPVLTQSSKADPAVRSLVPEVYGSQQTTPLKVSVSAGKNSFRFELKSDAKPAK